MPSSERLLDHGSVHVGVRDNPKLRLKYSWDSCTVRPQANMIRAWDVDVVQVDAYLKMSANLSLLCLPADGDQGTPKEETTRVSF